MPLPQFLSRLFRRLGLVAPAPVLEIDGHFYKMATQYYASARWATFATSGTVAGNLFHHAVELYLKGDLSRTVSILELKGLGHNLRRLWKKYKRKYSTVDFSAFENCIRELQRFETIRYPDAFAQPGMFYAIPVSHPQPPLVFLAAGASHPIQTYSVVVNDIDLLIRNIFTVSSFNPDFCFSQLGTEGRTILHRDNPAFP
jgi:HEPN domain-containing protein